MGKPGILIVHNTYTERGGEDSVVQQERVVLEKNGYPVYTIFFNNNPLANLQWRTALAPSRLFFNWTAYYRVYRLVKQHNIRYVHVHNFSYTASPSVFWAAKAAGAKTLFTVHNYRLFCLNGIFFRENKTCMLCQEQRSFEPGILYKCFKSSKLFSSLLASSIKAHRRLRTWHKKVDRFVVLNPLMHQLLANSGIPGHKLYDASNFINASLVHKPVSYSERGDFYLFTGRMTEEKGIRHIISAFKQSGRTLKMVGNGPMADWVRQEATGSISYQPAIPREELLVLYASCKALVFGSLWPEGQPLTLIEALSAGTPVIAGRSGITEVMIGAERGLLYEAGNANALNEAIGNFEQQTPEQCAAMSVNAYRYFLEKHTEEQHARSLNDLYGNEP